MRNAIITGLFTIPAVLCGTAAGEDSCRLHIQGWVTAVRIGEHNVQNHGAKHYYLIWGEPARAESPIDLTDSIEEFRQKSRALVKEYQRRYQTVSSGLQLQRGEKTRFAFSPPLEFPRSICELPEEQAIDAFMKPEPVAGVLLRIRGCASELPNSFTEFRSGATNLDQHMQKALLLLKKPGQRTATQYFRGEYFGEKQLRAKSPNRPESSPHIDGSSDVWSAQIAIGENNQTSLNLRFEWEKTYRIPKEMISQLLALPDAGFGTTPWEKLLRSGKDNAEPVFREVLLRSVSRGPQQFLVSVDDESPSVVNGETLAPITAMAQSIDQTTWPWDFELKPEMIVAADPGHAFEIRSIGLDSSRHRPVNVTIPPNLPVFQFTLQAIRRFTRIRDRREQLVVMKYKTAGRPSDGELVGIANLDTVLRLGNRAFTPPFEIQAHPDSLLGEADLHQALKGKLKQHAWAIFESAAGNAREQLQGSLVIRRDELGQPKWFLPGGDVVAEALARRRLGIVSPDSDIGRLLNWEVVEHRALYSPRRYARISLVDRQKQEIDSKNVKLFSKQPRGPFSTDHVEARRMIYRSLFTSTQILAYRAHHKPLYVNPVYDHDADTIVIDLSAAKPAQATFNVQGPESNQSIIPAGWTITNADGSRVYTLDSEGKLTVGSLSKLASSGAVQLIPAEATDLFAPVRINVNKISPIPSDDMSFGGQLNYLKLYLSSYEAVTGDGSPHTVHLNPATFAGFCPRVEFDLRDSNQGVRYLLLSQGASLPGTGFVGPMLLKSEDGELTPVPAPGVQISLNELLAVTPSDLHSQTRTELNATNRGTFLAASRASPGLARWQRWEQFFDDAHGIDIVLPRLGPGSVASRYELGVDGVGSTRRALIHAVSSNSFIGRTFTLEDVKQVGRLALFQDSLALSRPLTASLFVHPQLANATGLSPDCELCLHLIYVHEERPFDDLSHLWSQLRAPLARSLAAHLPTEKEVRIELCVLSQMQGQPRFSAARTVRLSAADEQTGNRLESIFTQLGDIPPGTAHDIGVGTIPDRGPILESLKSIASRPRAALCDDRIVVFLDSGRKFSPSDIEFAMLVVNSPIEMAISVHGIDTIANRHRRKENHRRLDNVVMQLLTRN